MTYGTRRRIMFQSREMCKIVVCGRSRCWSSRAKGAACRFVFSFLSLFSEKLQFLIRNSIPQEIDVQMCFHFHLLRCDAKRRKIAFNLTFLVHSICIWFHCSFNMWVRSWILACAFHIITILLRIYSFLSDDVRAKPRTTKDERCFYAHTNFSKLYISPHNWSLLRVLSQDFDSKCVFLEPGLMCLRNKVRTAAVGNSYSIRFEPEEDEHLVEGCLVKRTKINNSFIVGTAFLVLRLCFALIRPSSCTWLPKTLFQASIVPCSCTFSRHFERLVKITMNKI